MSKSKNMSGQHESNLFAIATRILIIAALALESCNSLKLENILMAQNNNKVCCTKQCKEGALVLKSAMDESVDPCNNFYRFACGRYPRTFPIPEGKSAKTFHFDWQKKISDEIDDIISKPINRNDPEAINRARMYYRMCLNTDEIDALGYEPLIQALGTINVPLIPIFPKDADIDFTTIAAKIAKYPAIHFMLTVAVSGDSSNQSINTVFIGKAGTSRNSRWNSESSNSIIDNYMFLEDNNENRSSAFFSAASEKNSNFARSLVNNKQDLKYPEGLPNSRQSPKRTNDTPEGQQTPPDPNGSEDKKNEETTSIPDKTKSALSNHVKKMINLLRPFATERSDVNLEDPQLNEDINNLYKFIAKRDTIRYSPYYDEWIAKKMTLEDLQNRTFERSDGNIAFEWKKYLDLIFDNIFGQSHQFDDDDEIIIYAWSYVKRVLKLYAKTDPRILVMAIWYDHITSLTLMTTKEMRGLFDEFRSEAFGAEPFDRTSFCRDNVVNNFSYAINFKFLKDPMAAFKKFKLEYMTEVIKVVFKNALKKADWIDPFSKKTALDKIDVMRKFVGFPSWATDVNVLNSMYAKEKLENFVSATIKSRVQSRLKNLSSLFSHNDESSKGFQLLPHVINACYVQTDNSITIPWAIMHLPYYGYGLDSLDLGAIGRIVGHEITHGYDDEGRKYNHDGNNSVWMTIPSKKSFREGAKCFMQSYSNIRIEEVGLNVNGELTLNENIADNGGISLAYSAFQILKKRNPPQLLVGYERYTPEQLFTIGVALQYCGNFGYYFLQRELKGVHPPAEARVNGMMMNFSEFPKIWNCKTNAPMNPSQKCKLW